MTKSYRHTPNSTSGWRDGEFAMRESVNQCLQNHIYEPFCFFNCKPDR